MIPVAQLPESSSLLPAIACAAGATGLYAVLAAFGLRYDPGWSGPAESARAVAPPRLALGTGGLVVVAAVGAAVGVRGVPTGGYLVLLIGQAALMAAAAVCDWRKWQLPLPFTLAGIALACMGLVEAGSAVLWALAGITLVASLVINALVTAGTWQGGDVLASIWIALALPGSALLAFALGQIGVSVLARVRRWPARQRIPLGGAWLIVAVLLLAAPRPSDLLPSPLNSGLPTRAPRAMPSVQAHPLLER